MCECKKSPPSRSESFALFYPYDRLKLYPFKSRLNSFGYEFKLSHYGVWLLFAVVLRIWYEIVVSQILQITYVFSTPCQCVICRYGDDHGTSISQVAQALRPAAQAVLRRQMPFQRCRRSRSCKSLFVCRQVTFFVPLSFKMSVTVRAIISPAVIGAALAGSPNAHTTRLFSFAAVS